MLLLAGTSDKIQVITASGVSTINVQASWVDMSGSTVTPGRANFNISTAATTDVVALIAGSTQRNIKTLSVYNSHASSSDVITIQHTDGTTVSILVKYTLLHGETIFYDDQGQFSVLDAAGTIKLSLSPGRYLVGVTLLTTIGTSAFVTSLATNHILVRLQAAGGGGGGCAAVAAGGAGGGSAGSYAEKYFAVSPGTGYTYAIPGGGTGATAGNNPGGNASNSTFAVGGVTVTAFGGNGGSGTAGGAASVALGGASPVSTNGDVNCGGSPGRPGMSLSTGVAHSGGGGSSYLGDGANPLNTGAIGNAATVGFGGGGGGGCTLSAVARSGGAGTQGCIIVEEYS